MNRFVVRVMLVTTAVMAAAPARARAQTAITPGMAQATFDTAWARIDRTFYDTAFLNTRWKVLRDSLRPIAIRCKTNADLRAVLQTLIASVGVSHFGLIAQEISPALNEHPAASSGGSGQAAAGTNGRPPAPGGGASGDIGASLRLAGDLLVVSAVDSGGAAWKAGVRPGNEVRRIDDFRTTDAMAQLTQIADPHVARQAKLTAVMHANSSLTGRVGDTVTLGLDSGPKGRLVPIVRQPVRGVMSKLGNLPPLNARLDVSEQAVGGRHIGVIKFSVWLPALSAGLDSAFDRFRNADAIVIDLRGNPGGLGCMVSLVAGHVLDSSYALGFLRQRNITLHFNANPQPHVYHGPVVVLVDALTGSTSEFFAAGLQALGRARVVGDTSAGAALPAVLDRLPNGDVMMHVVADLVDPKGRRVEGVGVIPDETVPLTESSLSAGRDDAMLAALRWAAAQPRLSQE
jgi:carboxyl-terminal processing protease